MGTQVTRGTRTGRGRVARCHGDTSNKGNTLDWKRAVARCHGDMSNKGHK